SIFGFSAQKVAAYSQPGGGLQSGDSCYSPNSAGAEGPMQFIPRFWIPYSTAVNRYGGYNHKPYIENIRDSVYAAAENLKKNSLAHGFDWTYENVRRAIICWNAGCSRLDNPPS